MKRGLLEIAVFLCGAIVMIYEIVGSRVVAPHFGTSLYVWTSLIGVILASLSAGYWLGGRLADRRPRFSTLSWIILFSAILIGLTTLVKDHVLYFLGSAFEGMMTRTLLGTIVLFAPASILLGMVSPYAVRLRVRAVTTSGATVGRLYAISTIGSIAGTFLAGFVLIPALGTTSILYVIAIILIMVSLSLYISFRNPGNLVVSVIMLAGLTAATVLHHNSRGNDIEVDTQYNHVRIFDTEYWISGEPIRVMKVNDEYSSAMFPGSDSLVYEYTWYYRLAGHFNPGFRSALLLGGAGYSYPKYYLGRYPHATIDVVEIDPGLTALAKEHFGLADDPRLRIFHEDARTFLNRHDGTYDVILGDAYKSLLAIPFQLTTLEAVRLKYGMLSDGGLVIENLIASLDGPASTFLKAQYATFREVFPRVYLFACHEPENREMLQSISLVALKSPEEPSFTSGDSLINALLGHRVLLQLSGEPVILTDDHAPVEYYAMKAL